MTKSGNLKINKWIPIVLAINIAALCFAIKTAMTYHYRNEIVKSELPITGYSILEVSKGRYSSVIRVVYAAKDYFVGVSRKQCEGTESVTLYYDKKHDTVFEKDELSMRQVVFFFATFAFSLLLWGAIRK